MPSHNGASQRHQARALRDSRAARRGRDGRSLSRKRHAAGPHGRDQSAGFTSFYLSGTETTIRARGAQRLFAESRAHLPALRRRLAKRHRISGDGIPGGGNPGRAAAQRPPAAARIAEDRDGDCGGAGSGASRGNHSPRPEAGEHHADERRRQADGFRFGQTGGDQRSGNCAAFVRGANGERAKPAEPVDHGGRDHRNDPVHVARADRGQGSGCARGHFFVWRGAVRNGHGQARV